MLIMIPIDSVGLCLSAIMRLSAAALSFTRAWQKPTRGYAILVGRSEMRIQRTGCRVLLALYQNFAFRSWNGTFVPH